MCRVLIDNAKPRITTKYSSKHKAIDLVKYYSSTCEVVAHSKGKVIWLQKGQKNNQGSTGNKSYGNCVKLKHDDGYYTLYAHLKDVKVKLGQVVSKGQSLGYMGNTGNSYGAHLHWEVRNKKNVRIDPTPYLDKDLPSSKRYQVYDNYKKKWLPTIRIGTDDYAGNFGHPISAFRTEDCEEFRAYDIVKKKWLPPCKSYNEYAGNLGNNIGAIAIKSTKLKYRVRLQKSKRWLGWIIKYDLKDFNNGFAGNLNEPIDAIQIVYK